MSLSVSLYLKKLLFYIRTIMSPISGKLFIFTSESKTNNVIYNNVLEWYICFKVIFFKIIDTDANSLFNIFI